jgi:superfamily I DNA/RNA helicase
VNAVAGSGKTWTLVEACKLLRTDRALFCAFNKHIAEALKARLPKSVTSKTLHSVGYGALASKWGKLRLDEDKIRSLAEKPGKAIHKKLEKALLPLIRRGEDVDIPDLGQVCGWLKELAHFARVSLTDHADAKALEGMADYYGIDVDPLVWREVAEATRDLIEESNRIAREKRVIDYDDMVYLPVHLGFLPARYDWVCLDEAQDLSAAQRALAISCLAPGGRMLAVGDPRQSIQGFAGADPESFQSLKAELDAVELPLSVCYRCPTSHLDLARQIVPQIEAAPGAETGTLDWMKIQDVLAGVQEGDLILSRMTAPAVSLCIQLIARKIPARVKGRDIGAALARDVEQISEQPGFKMAEFEHFAQAWFQKREVKLLKKKGEHEAQVQALWDRFEGLMACYDAYPCENAIGLVKAIQSLFDDDRRSVTLSTIHRAKGLEADRVWVLGADKLPAKFRGMQEWEKYQEECIHYVALTRAKREMYLVEAPPKEKR